MFRKHLANVIYQLREAIPLFASIWWRVYFVYVDIASPSESYSFFLVDLYDGMIFCELQKVGYAYFLPFNCICL